jgi:chitinase
MVSAFGSTDSPVSNGVDPVDCARRLASWVREYDLDGVDIDWEDMHAMNTGIGEAWLITFQSELRRQLPAGQYLISHAPVAPWFTSGPNYPNGAYVAVHKQTGDGIDFYNMQFYNQGHGVYEDCQVSTALDEDDVVLTTQSLVFNSGSNWPSTSVMEMNSYAGIPLNKIVIGKPINAGAANNG